ncbi:MAG: hypothetical protein A2383_01660 [Candidatus Pacebacteria bacterium RIFOXYB1_FULL_39_46]|nr:MAG: hypothetical protein A2182_03175 [Candidatus Pacebacteria bacterium RIFOXYA1_FULL_38_18]OGJ37875.1 MAG: hypothetical protein A2383_01660 [Candidatus Pacebacteria bacterium RIFOXYB1_FULL_39_46]OGJ39474.1 MAG: hypothetical protein A2411_01815 [Candidatus Pacebacteria bacterium RIFOXYC1_FULL_39_21]
MKKIARIVLITIIGLFFLSRIKSILVSGNSFFATLQPIIDQPFASYDEKMAMQYPVYYDFIQDIKKITSEDSLIYLPEINISRPQPMWALSSIHITQPLLYPRKVQKFDINNLPLKKAGDPDTYIVVAYGYPKIVLPDYDLILLVDDKHIASEKYDSSVFEENKMAGLILVE